MVRNRTRQSDQNQGDQRHGYVDPENRPPRPLGQVAAKHRADGGEPAGQAEEDGQRLAPLADVECLNDYGQRGREHQGTTDALNGAKGDDPRFGGAALWCEAAHRGCAREDDDPYDHHFGVPCRVGQPAAEGEQRGQ